MTAVGRGFWDRAGVIRPCAAADKSALYEICLLTGTETGEDASDQHTDHHLLGEVYSVPYLHAPSALGFVAVDGGGVGGYVVGAADTGAFERWCEEAWWPPLRARHPVTDADTADGRMIRYIHDPEVTEGTLLADHPAHVHINLLPRFRGQGVGARLMSTMLTALASAGARGVHLGVAAANERAIGFYRRVGFTEHARTDGEVLMVQRL